MKKYKVTVHRMGGHMVEDTIVYAPDEDAATDLACTSEHWRTVSEVEFKDCEMFVEQYSDERGRSDADDHLLFVKKSAAK